MDSVLYYVELIGKIIATGLSVLAILWSLISVVKKLIEQMETAIENKDWESMINIINEFVIAVEEKYLNQESAGSLKKAEVVALLKEAGYEVTSIIDALIETAVYKQFNFNKKNK